MTDAREPTPPDEVPGDTAQPTNRPLDREGVSEPLDDAEGDEYRVEQQPTGADNVEGSGEWPHPDTPPSDSAIGSTRPDEPGSQ